MTQIHPCSHVLPTIDTAADSTDKEGHRIAARSACLPVCKNPDRQDVPGTVAPYSSEQSRLHLTMSCTQMTDACGSDLEVAHHC